ncbi:MAG: HisA/HisF-related TIM barrel protein [Candidatus Methanoperedens sp.]|nr:HisA/HisF-related TIM barrel protein [Candidatus Methanoperedens sp.]
MFRIIFVIDLLNGSVVHAVKGERSKYKPIKDSMICDSSDPFEIISSVKPREIYIADLDHIQNIGDNFEIIKKISGKTQTMVDIGVKNMADVKKCAEIADTVIIGTETASLEVIENAAIQFLGRINVSIDMKNGYVLTKDMTMEVRPEELVRRMNEIGIKDIIILDLGKVGTSAGINEIFLKKIAEISTHNILVGGGIKDVNDIEILEKSGISGALAATALHNGNIPIGFIH